MFGYFVTGDEVPVSPEPGAGGGPGGGGRNAGDDYGGGPPFGRSGRNASVIGGGPSYGPRGRRNSSIGGNSPYGPDGGGRRNSSLGGGGGLAPPSGPRGRKTSTGGGGGPPPSGPITNDTIFKPGGKSGVADLSKRNPSINPSDQSTQDHEDEDLSNFKAGSLTKAQAKRKAQLLQSMQARVANLTSTQKALEAHPPQPHQHKNLHQTLFGGSKKKPDRKFGYGDIKIWNALSTADQARIRDHSVKLLQSFRITKWFLRVMGRFPFDPKKLEDGSYTFTWSPCSFSYVLFLLSSIIAICIFIMFTIGFVFIFIVVDPESQLHDRCGNSWGTTILSRNMPAVVFVWSQMMLSAAGSVYVMIHGQSFLEYYILVNEAVMQLDMDPSHGTFYSDIRGMIVFGCLFLACIVVEASGVLKSLDEVCVFVVQCLCFLFIKDIYAYGSSDIFTATEYEVLREKCVGGGQECGGCYGSFLGDEVAKRCGGNGCYNIINTPTFYAGVAKWVGFGIILGSILGSRALIRQFEFFCQVVVNLQSMWNKRFLNYASSSKDITINMDDVYRRRINDQMMLKDHYEVVRLYNETEVNFSFILFVYYSSVFFNLICQFYYSALLSSQVTCATAVQRERDAALKGSCHNISTELVLNHTYSDRTVSFEDACSVPHKQIIKQASITTTVLLIVTLSSFIITTLEADRASQQANIGFYRVRKRGYLSCRTKKERNAMHALVFSFTGPKPFCITAAKYFPVRKKTIVVVTSVAFIYFLIILGFKPGSNSANVRCWTLSADNRTVYQVRYPAII